NFEKKFFHLDLISMVFQEAVLRKNSPALKYVVIGLVEANTPDNKHIFSFNQLSDTTDLEPLRQMYVETLEKFLPKKSPLITQLICTPNRAGVRLQFQRKYQQLQETLGAYISSKPHNRTDIPQVKIISSCQEGYLKPEIIQQILDDKGDIKFCPGSAH